MGAHSAVRAHLDPTSALARIVLQGLGPQKLTLVTNSRISHGECRRFACSENLPRFVSPARKARYLRNGLRNTLLDGTLCLCHHLPKRTICRCTPVRTSKNRAPEPGPMGARLAPRLSRKWRFSPPTCKGGSEPATLRSARFSAMPRRNCGDGIFLRSLPRWRKPTASHR